MAAFSVLFTDKQSSQWQVANDDPELELDLELHQSESGGPLVLLEGQGRPQFCRNKCFRDSFRETIVKT